MSHVMSVDEILAQDDGKVMGLEACVFAFAGVAHAQSQASKAERRTYTDFLSHARKIYAEVFETWKSQGSNEDTAWYEIAADYWLAEVRGAIAAASKQGLTESQYSKADRYGKELYDAMTANAPLLELDNQSGKYLLGGRSAVTNWMKELREWAEALQRERTLAQAESMGVAARFRKPEQGEDNAAETGTQVQASDSVLSLLPDEVRNKFEEAIYVAAELCEHTEKGKGNESGVAKAMRAANGLYKNLLAMQADFTAVEKAAEEEAEAEANAA